jgi:NADPH:quinone reductase-like Zn-dependent oxidoreductase
MPGVSTPALGLPYPSLEKVDPIGKVLFVNGGSAAVGNMVTQVASAAGITVITTASGKNLALCESAGASKAIDRKDPGLVEKIVAAVKQTGEEFIGVFDAVSEAEAVETSLAVLTKLGGGHLACVHPPPPNVPEGVTAGMIFAVNDIADPVWESFVTPALESGKIQCLPRPTVVGKGLEHINEALKMSKAGVSATKLVVEL